MGFLWPLSFAVVVLGTLLGFSETRSDVSSATSVAAAPRLGGGGGGGLPLLPGADALPRQFERVVRAVDPSVVQIETQQGLGSGVILDTRGHIVTNAHVIGGARRFIVTLHDGTRTPGQLVGSFAPEDIGVIEINTKKLRPISWGDSARLEVGEIVMAIGNPLGLRASVTQGIVSAVGRLGEEGGGIVLPDVLQTSAAINPGNSGGALVNLRGQLVGIPTLAAINPEVGTPANEIGFAISSNRALFIARQLVAKGRVSNTGRAYIGVRVARALGAPGVIIASVVPGSPAARAGLHVGDAIVSIAGQPTPDAQTLASVLATRKPGQTVTITTLSPQGHRRSVQLKLAQLPGGV